MIDAIVTCYNPNTVHVENIYIIAQQVDKVYIVDNSIFSNEGLFEELLSNMNCTYTFWGENRGLSSAFNYILYRYKEVLINDYIVFFDQDSKIQSDHIAKLMKAFVSLEEKQIPVGCLAPTYFNTSNSNVERPKNWKKLSEHAFSVESLITSSMITKYIILQKVDFWNEKVFLDGADWDLCWRIKDKGFLCCMVDNIKFIHSVGEGELGKGFLKIRICQPIRDYYRTRDFLYLLNQHYSPTKAKCRMLFDLTMGNFEKIILLKQKKERFFYILKGWKDHKDKKYGCFR